MLSHAHIEALQVLADVYLEQDRAKDAVMLLRALVHVAPSDIGVWRALSYASLSAGAADAALIAADALLRLETPSADNAPILLLRAQALRVLGRAGEAQESLNRYLQLRPDAP